jgi:hypothetical protein
MFQPLQGLAGLELSQQEKKTMELNHTREKMKKNKK